MDDKAIAIAKEHLRRMNPSLWDGTGDRPESFDPIILTHPVDDENELDISFEEDRPGQWIHLCELRDRESEELMEIMSGNGINSEEALAETIRAICGTLLEKA